MLNAAAIVALLSHLALGEAVRVRNLVVERRTLFGYAVAGGRPLDLEEAAEEVSSLLGRVRAGLRNAAGLARLRGLSGGHFVILRASAEGVLVAVVDSGAKTELARRTLIESLIGDGFFCRGRDGGVLVTGGYL